MLPTQSVFHCTIITEYITTTTLEAFIKRISKLSSENSSTQNFLYRGHKSHKYDAVPSVSRNDGWLENEDEMIKSLLASQASEFAQDLTTFERLVRAQHYGLPTRLLDVTRNPLVALYFACKTATEKLKNGKEINLAGEVILFTPSKEKRKYFDSDTVTCLANLALLKRTEIDSIRRHALNCRDEADVMYPDDSVDFHRYIVERFNHHDDVTRLSKLTAIERPGFESRIHPFDLSNPIYAQPRKLHRRLAAQDGAFLIFGLFWHLDEHLFLDQIERIEIRIPHRSKSAILSGLERLGISDETLFPEIDRSALQIRRNFERAALQAQKEGNKPN